MKAKVSGKMTRKTPVLLGLVAAVIALGACTQQQEGVFGEEKAAPDEFAVYSRAPLSLPPDFGLRPPKPGVTRPQTVRPRNDAKQALLSSSGQKRANISQPATNAEANLTPGGRALLNNTGADQANPDIRSLVNNETSVLSGGGDENFVDEILFWRESPGLKGAVIDPAVEDRRMRIKKAQGEVIEETPTTTIQRRGGGESRAGEGKGFWGSLFE